jgi:phosphoribosylformimino-5-aminoimidazole carboxamide ribotide isomerase
VDSHHDISSLTHFAELGEWVNIPTTYAGGAKSRAKSHRARHLSLIFDSGISDLDLVDELSGGKVDLTYGR